MISVAPISSRAKIDTTPGWCRADADRRRHSHSLRPMVEPCGRGSGDRPRAPHRPGQAGVRPSADRARHYRGEDGSAESQKASSGRRYPQRRSRCYSEEDRGGCGSPVRCLAQCGEFLERRQQRVGRWPGDVEGVSDDTQTWSRANLQDAATIEIERAANTAEPQAASAGPIPRRRSRRGNLRCNPPHSQGLGCHLWTSRRHGRPAKASPSCRPRSPAPRQAMFPGTVSSTRRARCPTLPPAMAATPTSSACWSRKASSSTTGTASIWTGSVGLLEMMDRAKDSGRNIIACSYAVCRPCLA